MYNTLLPNRLLICIFFIIYVIINAVGQDNHYIGTSMVSIFNFRNPYIPFEYNRKLDDRVRLSAGIGTIVRTGLWNQGRSEITKEIKKQDERGVRLSVEPQFMFKPQKSRAEVEGKIHENSYLSLDLSALTYKYTSIRGFEERLDTLKNFNVSNRTLGLNALYGQMRMIKKNRFSMLWVFNVGGGVRFVNIKNNLDIPFEQLSTKYRSSPKQEPEEKGNYIRFSVVINAKVYISIGKS
jgi:hypothetical protein